MDLEDAAAEQRHGSGWVKSAVRRASEGVDCAKLGSNQNKDNQQDLEQACQ